MSAIIPTILLLITPIAKSASAKAHFRVTTIVYQVASQLHGRDTNIYTIKNAGIQFEVPKGWKVEVDNSSGNTLASVADGALTVTFVVDDDHL